MIHEMDIPLYTADEGEEAYALPIPTPEMPGPFARPSDQIVLAWLLCLGIQLQGGLKVYRDGLQDEKQQDMAARAVTALQKFVHSQYGERHARTILMMSIEEARKAWDSSQDSLDAREKGWITHAYYVARVIVDILEMHRAASTGKGRATLTAVDRMLGCAFPDEFCHPIRNAHVLKCQEEAAS